MRFKTENLYLVKISKIVKIEEMSDKIRRYYDTDVRYALAYLKDGEYKYRMTYVDVFTHTKYQTLVNADVTGISTVVEAEPVITNTEYLTEEEALRILKELNPTYLKEVEKENTKRLRLFK